MPRKKAEPEPAQGQSLLNLFWQETNGSTESAELPAGLRPGQNAVADALGQDTANPEDYDLDLDEEGKKLEDAETVQDYFTVGQITRYLQALIGGDELLGYPIRVRGELSNVKHTPRGHVYFTLKDEEASINCIVWASKAKLLPFKLENGIEVDVTGEMDIYAPSGTYSIKCDRIDPVGAGTLQMAFEQLKQRLTAEGLFDPRHKKPLPEFPLRIGIVTSRTGAVIHDMLRVIRRKNAMVNVLLAPASVQGEGAALSIAKAIQELNHPHYKLDLLIVGRGGGSFEDLFCFSEEAVVRAVFGSQVPVITGIGHEPDFALADAAADYSASTPTAAAEKAVPDLVRLGEDLEAAKLQLARELTRTVMHFEQTLDLKATQFVESLERSHQRSEEKVATLQEKLISESRHLFKRFEQTIAHHAGALDAFNPLKTLARGYSVATGPDGKVIQSIADATAGQAMALNVTDGIINCEVKSCHARPNPLSP